METDFLIQVVTASEAAHLWNKSRFTILTARNSSRNPLDYRLSGRTVLITVESLKRRYGDPVKPIVKSY